MKKPRYIPPRPDARTSVHQETEARTRSVLAQAEARGAVHLLLAMLGLRGGGHVVALVVGPAARRAQRNLEHDAGLLRIACTALEVGQVDVFQQSSKEDMERALSRADGCVVLASGVSPVTAALEDWLRSRHQSVPTVFLRDDAEALLTQPAREAGLGLGSRPEGEHHELSIWLAARLARARYLDLDDGAGTRLTAELAGDPVPVGRRQLDATTWVFPCTPVSAALAGVEGKLVGPAVFMPDGSADGHAHLRTFQFHDGRLRGVAGPHGAVWMREALQRAPGLQVARVAFGTADAMDGGALGGVDTRPTAFARSGCVLTLAPPPTRQATRAHLPYRGVSFCVASPTLDVRLDGTPIIRDGRYTEAAKLLASRPTPLIKSY